MMMGLFVVEMKGVEEEEDCIGDIGCKGEGWDDIGDGCVCVVEFGMFGGILCSRLFINGVYSFYFIISMFLRLSIVVFKMFIVKVYGINSNG